MQRPALALFVLLLVTFGCRRLPNVQGKGEAVLQGLWKQDSVANAGKLLNYTQYQLKITCDSFYVTMNVHAKINYLGDDCFKPEGWREYAKGTYLLNRDTLMLNGTYTRENFKQKLSGCYTTGRYLQNFLLLKAEKETLTLENLANHQETILNLKETITCTPKAL